MFYVVRIYRGSDPIPLAVSTPVDGQAVEAAVGDIALGFKTLGAEIRYSPNFRLPQGVEPEPPSLDIALSRFKLSLVIDAAGTSYRDFLPEGVEPLARGSAE